MNRIEYEREKRDFDERKLANRDESLNVISGVKHRREIKAA